MFVATPNAVYPEHYDEVKAQMIELGAPEIRAIWDGEIYWAVEGSHRLTAAKELGLIPRIVHIEYSEDDEIETDWDGGKKTFAVSDLAEILMSNREANVIEFGEVEIVE